MTVTLELSPEEAAALQARAGAGGTDVEAVLHGLIAPLVAVRAASPSPAQGPPTDDADEDPDERAERERDLAEFKANMNRWRAEQGRPPLA